MSEQVKTIKPRFRGQTSGFTEQGLPKLCVKFTAHQMDFLNLAAAQQQTSLAEIVRRCVQKAMEGCKP